MLITKERHKGRSRGKATAIPFIYLRWYLLESQSNQLNHSVKWNSASSCKNPLTRPKASLSILKIPRGLDRSSIDVKETKFDGSRGITAFT